MTTHCRRGHLYAPDCPRDYRGDRQCPTCHAANREKQRQSNRRKRLEFSGGDNIRAVGDTPAQQQAREAAAYWAYGDRSELRYG